MGSQGIHTHAVRLAEKAAHKVTQMFPSGTPAEPEIGIPDESCVRLPGLPDPLQKAYFE